MSETKLAIIPILEYLPLTKAVCCILITLIGKVNKYVVQMYTAAILSC